MRKILAMLLALVLAISALTVAAFADDKVVFDNPDGQAWDDCVNSWDFFGVGGLWGREAATALDISIEDLVDLFADGGYSFVYVYSGNPGYNNGGIPTGVVNGDFENGAPCEVVDLADGTHQATVKLSDVLAAAGVSADSVENFVIQMSTDDFKLISAKFTNDAAAPAPAPAPAADETPAADEAPAANDAPAANEAPAAAPAPAKTGIVLAVLPMAVAAAAVIASKRR